MAEIRVILESEDEKSRIELEASKLGLSQTAFMRLVVKNWIGEVKFERKPDGNNDKKGE